MADFVRSLGTYLQAENDINAKKEAQKQKILDKMGMVPTSMLDIAGQGQPVGEGEVFGNPKTAERVPSTMHNGVQYSKYTSPIEAQNLATSKAQEGVFNAEKIKSLTGSLNSLTGGGTTTGYGSTYSNKSGASGKNFQDAVRQDVKDQMDFMINSTVNPSNTPLGVLASNAFVAAAHVTAIKRVTANMKVGENKKDIIRDVLVTSLQTQIQQALQENQLSENGAKSAWRIIEKEDGSTPEKTLAEVSTILTNEETKENFSVSQTAADMSDFNKVFAMPKGEKRNAAFQAITDGNPEAYDVKVDEKLTGGGEESEGGLFDVFSSDPAKKRGFRDTVQTEIVDKMIKGTGQGLANVYMSLPADFTGMTPEQQEAFYSSNKQFDIYPFLKQITSALTGGPSSLLAGGKANDTMNNITTSLPKVMEGDSRNSFGLNEGLIEELVNQYDRLNGSPQAVGNESAGSVATPEVMEMLMMLMGRGAPPPDLANATGDPRMNPYEGMSNSLYDSTGDNNVPMPTTSPSPTSMGEMGSEGDMMAMIKKVMESLGNSTAEEWQLSPAYKDTNMAKLSEELGNNPQLIEMLMKIMGGEFTPQPGRMPNIMNSRGNR